MSVRRIAEAEDEEAAPLITPDDALDLTSDQRLKIFVEETLVADFSRVFGEETRFSEEQQDELATLSGLYESASAFLGEIAEGHDSASKVRC